MPTIAQPINNSGHPWSVELTVDGYRGTRWYKVNTGDPTEAITASGLPRLNEYWDQARVPLLQCRSIGPTESWSQVVGVDQDNGWTYVPVYYDTVTAIRLTPHTVYTRTQQSSTVRKGLVFNAQDADPLQVTWIPQSGTTIQADVNARELIAQGDGATKYFSTLQADVHCYIPLGNPIDFALLDQAAMDPPVNSDTVYLPPVYGHNQIRRFNPGMLRACGYEAEIINNYWHYTLKLEVAFNHFAYWTNVNADGIPAGEKIYASKIYRNLALSPYIPWSPPPDGSWHWPGGS